MRNTIEMHTLLAAGYISGVSVSHNLFALPLIESVQNVEEKKNLYAHYLDTSRKYFLASTLLFTGAYTYLWINSSNNHFLIPFGLTMAKVPIHLAFKTTWDDEEDELNVKEKDTNRFLKK